MLNFIERAFQRRITCAIWTRNERDMQFWKSVRARIRYSAAAPKSSAAMLVCPDVAAFCPDFWACDGLPSAAAPKSQRRGARVARARSKTRVFDKLWPKTHHIKAKSPPKHLRPDHTPILWDFWEKKRKIEDSTKTAKDRVPETDSFDVVNIVWSNFFSCFHYEQINYGCLFQFHYELSIFI